MKAMAIHGFGGTDQFEEITIPSTEPRDGEVLIKVAASSVNPLDYKLRAGTMPDLINNFPMVLHGDVSGVIEKTGNGVDDFSVGDEVYGCVGGLLNLQGALAEYVVTDANLINKKPKTLSLLEAAALPLVSETVWEALVNKTQVQKGARVLIHGGTGGVGHFAIMLAKYLGAKVYATVSSNEKSEIAKKLGADYTINYKEQDVQEYVNEFTDGNGFEIVFDTVGQDNLEKSIQSVAANGDVISILGAGEHDLTNLFFKSANLHMVLQPLPLITGQRRADYKELLGKVAEVIDREGFKPLLDKNKFTFSNVAAAHEHLESGLAIGKVVLENDL